MKLKISKSFLALLVLIQSASLSSADVGEFVFQHQTLSQAVLDIIRSLDGDEASVTNIIKLTSHGADARRIDPFTEEIVRGVDGLVKLHSQDYEEASSMKRIQHDALLILDNEMTIREIEKFLLSFKFESHRKLLVVVPNKVVTENSIKLMLDIMWRKFILNVHVLTTAHNGKVESEGGSVNLDLHLYTFFPFTKDFCGQVRPVVWNIYRNSNFVMEREHFPRKNENLFQCTLSVAVFNAPPFMILLNDENGTIDVDGSDGNLLKTLASEFNFSINYIVVSEDIRWGELYANQSATGAIAVILNRSVDLSLGMFSKTATRLKFLSMSITYAQAPLVMIVPPGREFNSILKLLSPFDVSVWFVVSGMMSIVLIFTTILKYQSRRVQDFVFGKQNRTPYLNVMNVVVGLPVYKTPGRNFSRWMLMMFVILWLVMRSLYQAVLYKDLQSTPRTLPVQSIEESLRRGFVYYMISPTHENVKYLPEVYDRRIIVSRNDSLDYVKRLSHPSVNAAFLAGLDTVRYSNKHLLYNYSLSICPETLLLRQYGIVYPKDSFLVQSFDKKVRNLIENGLFVYWLSKHTENIKQRQPLREPMKLSLNHLASAYQVLCFGISFASAILLLELLSIKLKRLRKFFWFFE